MLRFKYSNGSEYENNEIRKEEYTFQKESENCNKKSDITVGSRTGKNYTDEDIKFVFDNNIVVGYSASVYNGLYCYNCFPITVYTDVKILDDVRTPSRKFVYLPNYDTVKDIERNLPSPERTICDYLMYPEELLTVFHLVDTLEGYEDEYGNFDKVYELMKYFNIPKEKLEKWLPFMWDGGMFIIFLIE